MLSKLAGIIALSIVLLLLYTCIGVDNARRKCNRDFPKETPGWYECRDDMKKDYMWWIPKHKEP